LFLSGAQINRLRAPFTNLTWKAAGAPIGQQGPKPLPVPQNGKGFLFVDA
jgi:hypothetical protein